MAIFKLENNRLYWQHGAEKILIQPWGDNGLRVRVTRAAKLDESEDWALLPAGDHKAEMAMVKTAPKNKKQMAAAGGPGRASCGGGKRRLHQKRQGGRLHRPPWLSVLL